MLTMQHCHVTADYTVSSTYRLHCSNENNNNNKNKTNKQTNNQATTTSSDYYTFN